MITTPRLLLCTDLDRTLLPNGTQPESPQARARFQALVSHPDVALVYASGRDRGLVERAIGCYGLPRPDFAVTDVGTNVYDLREPGWMLDSGWQAEIAPDWNGHDRGFLRGLLEGIAPLRPQEHTKQNTFKLSYYLPRHASQAALQTEVEARFAHHSVRASLVWSIDEPAGVGLLDIVPRGATKLHAVRYVGRVLGVGADRIVYAGDSGNDLPVMASEVPSVLVANALPAVAQEAVAAAEVAGNLERLYLARGERLGMNGNYAAGILEGVAHYHPDLVERFAPGERYLAGDSGR